VTDLPEPSFAPRDQLKVGQWVVASGVGFGAAEPVLSVGIISATSRISGKAVQTDANTSPANYGGPLLDLEGRVIGVCVPLSPGSRAEAAGAEWYDSGIGFAIPLDDLDGVLARLKAGERLQHAFVGVRAAPFGDPPSGASVEDVVADSPAAKAGLVAKDKFTTFGGTEVLDVPHLAMLIGRYVAGDSVEVVVERDGARQTVQVELGVPPPSAQPMPPIAVEKAKTPKGKRPFLPKAKRPAI
jgi:serine protease Do